MSTLFFYTKEQFFNFKTTQTAAGFEFLRLSKLLSSQKIDVLDEYQPVSYTHLDFRKRCNRFIVCPFTDELLRVFVLRRVALDAARQHQRRTKPHRGQRRFLPTLFQDVYKRQFLHHVLSLKKRSGLHPNAPSKICRVRLTFARDVFFSLSLRKVDFPYSSFVAIQT